ncbi:MAG: TonB-dependent receptor [Candidatus Binatia bacterium]
MIRRRAIRISLLAWLLGMATADGQQNVPSADTPDAPPPRVIEEIVVTAQRREQLIEDVPISMSVLDSEFITDQGIGDVREALLFTPNARVDSAGFFAAPRIRGFTFNNNNKAFEPPAGLALDGVPYTRVGYFTSALFDVERVEVLRGPQGITFGKNTTSGLINIISKKPTKEFTGFVDGQLGTLDLRRLEAAISGPVIADVLNFRLAGLLDEQDGFIRNTTAAVAPAAAERLRGKDRQAFRAKLAFPDLFGSTLDVGYEHADLRDGGTGVELFHITPEVEAVLRRYDPNVDIEKGNFIASLDNPDSRKNVVDTVSASWNYPLGGWDLNALAAHSILDEVLQIDADLTPVPAIPTFGTDRSPTTTAELRALSPRLPGLFGLERLFGLALGGSDVLLGFFHQRREINDSELRVAIVNGPFLELTAAAQTSAGLPLPPLPPPPPGYDDLREEVSQFFEQSGDTIAGYTQMQWYLTDRWTLQYGMRLSRETKNGAWRQLFNTLARDLLLAGGFREFTAERSLSEFQFQPKVSLGYQPLDSVSLFAHWTRGFKGGGFNAFAFRPEDDPTAETATKLTYDPEITTEWGIDAKTTLLDGAARFNLSLYRMDVEDFQVLTRLPEDTTVGLGVAAAVNASEARAQGIEADLAWLATSWLTVIGTVGLNDTEYGKFPFNECATDRPNTDGDGDDRCDATGRPFFGAPEWTNTLTTLFRFPLTAIPVAGGALPPWAEGIDWTTSFTGEFIDVFYADVDLDPRKKQPSFFRYRAGIGFADSARGWSLKVTGENLTNEATSIRMGDPAAGVFVTASEPSRMFLGQFRWEF